MSTKNLTKQEISMAIIIWDSVYKAISKHFVQFEGRTEIEKEEIIGDAVSEIIPALNKQLSQEIAKQIEEIERRDILWHLVEDVERDP